MPARNAIVINLTRFGDLLQSQPVFNALSAQGRTTTLVCLENFAFTAQLLRNVHRTCPLPGAGLLKKLDISWLAAMGELRTWVDGLLESLPGISHSIPQDIPQDIHLTSPLLAPTSKPGVAVTSSPDQSAGSSLILINLTPALPGRILGRIIQDRLQALGVNVESRGFGMDQFGFGVNHNPWVAYLLASCQERGQSQFNLADVFYRAAGFTDRADPRLAEPAPDLAEQSLSGLQVEAPPGYAGFVAFQLGASAEMRRWPVEYFCKVGEMLWEQARLCPVLLGTKSELPLTEEYQRLCNGLPFINLCGRTSPLELAATLKNCALLVTNDTGTMHLAAGLGLDIVAIFLVTAQACDTGPYLDGACLIEPALPCHPCAFGSQCPHDHSCRHNISPQLVGSLALDKISRQKPMARKEAQAEARVWLSGRDTGNLMDLQSVSGHEQEQRSILFKLLRHFQRQLLDRAPGQNWSLFSLAPGQRLNPDILRECLELEALLHLLREQGGMLVSHPLPLLKTRFLASWQRAREAMTKSRYFSSFGRIWLEESQNLAENLEPLLALSASYQEMFAAIRQSLESQDPQIKNTE